MPTRARFAASEATMERDLCSRIGEPRARLRAAARRARRENCIFEPDSYEGIWGCLVRWLGFGCAWRLLIFGVRGC